METQTVVYALIRQARKLPHELRRSLTKEAHISRADETAGRIICHPISGLHHQYTRICFAIRTA
jgi:hypothetical protein